MIFLLSITKLASHQDNSLLESEVCWKEKFVTWEFLLWLMGLDLDQSKDRGIREVLLPTKNAHISLIFVSSEHKISKDLLVFLKHI